MKISHATSRVLIACWAATIAVGIVMLCGYMFTPAAQATTESQFPRLSGLQHRFGQMHVLMFVHPQCQCTIASVEEFKRQVSDDRWKHARSGQVTLVIRQPAESSATWQETNVTELCRSIPGARVINDPDGVEARRFNVNSSGTCCLFDESGRLQFLGGVTISRGHRGRSPGADAFSQCLQDRTFTYIGSPVFGCALFSDTR